jgi:tetratricopeptide (TPR) repeat protein
LTSRSRSLAALAATLVIFGAALQAGAAPKPSPSPSATGATSSTGSPAASASGSPAPAPTATPEPPEVAIPRLEAKLKANASDKPTLTELAGYYLAVGRADQALALTQRLISLGEKSAQVYYLDGVANQSLGRGNDALADFENASNQDPTNPQILLTLTSLYLQSNRAPDAERVAKRATTFNPNDKRSFENYGLVLAQEKKYDDARAAFEQAAKIDPKDPSPVVLEARSYIDQNAFALASQLFDRALTIDPKYGDALLGKARLLAAEHNVKDAIAEYEVLLPTLTSDDAKAAVLIEEFKVYAQEKLSSDAERTIHRALDSYDKVPAVHIAYGDYLATNKDTAGAEREWNAANANNNSGDALQRLGELYLSQNKINDGLARFKRLSELAPNDPAVWLQLGQVYSYQKNFQAAHDSYLHSFAIQKAPQSLAGIAAADYQLKNWKECSAAFDAIDKNAADFLKQNPQLFYPMGECYLSSAQNDKAKSALQRLQPSIKPGSQLDKEVRATLARLNGGGSRPAPKPTAKPTAKPSH